MKLPCTQAILLRNPGSKGDCEDPKWDWTRGASQPDSLSHPALAPFCVSPPDDVFVLPTSQLSEPRSFWAPTIQTFKHPTLPDSVEAPWASALGIWSMRWVMAMWGQGKKCSPSCSSMQKLYLVLSPSISKGGRGLSLPCCHTDRHS